MRTKRALRIVSLYGRYRLELQNHIADLPLSRDCPDQDDPISL